MAHIIAIPTADGDEAYWTGGEIFGECAEDAVRFNSKADADRTIELLKPIIGLFHAAVRLDVAGVLVW